MRTGYFAKLFSWVLVAQMLLTPMGQAQQAQSFNLGNALTQTLQQVLGAQQAQIAQLEAQQRSVQRRNFIEPRNCSGRQCTSGYFPGCAILRDIPNIVEASACEEGQLDPANPADQGRFLDALSLVSDYTYLQDSYRNFNSESTQNSREGVTCLSRAANELENALVNREKEIDELIRRMQDVQNKQFKPALEADLTVIEDSMALLQGNEFAGRKAALTQNSFKFADAFKGAPCNAVFGESRFESDGRRGGFNAIQKTLQDTVSSPSTAGGPGSFAASGFTADTARSLTAEITRISNAISSDIRNSGPNNLATAANGINDTYGLLPRLTPIMQEQARTNASFERELTQEANRYSSPQRAQPLYAALFNESDEVFNNAITDYQNELNRQCLQNHENIKNLLNGTIRMRIQGADGGARVNVYLAQLNEIINNPTLSLEEKQTRVSQLAGPNYIVELNGPLVVDNGEGNTAGTTGRTLSPAQFINAHIQNCQQRLTARNGRSSSDREMLDKFRQTRARYSAYRRNLPNQVAAAINTRLNSCADTQQASAAGTGTCSATDLSTSSSTFCVTRALNCANKMNACYQQTQQQVANVTARRDQAVNRYRTNVQRNQAQLVAMYGQLNQILSMQSSALVQGSSEIRAALVLPPEVDITLDFNARAGGGQNNQNYVRGLAELEIMNPEAYFNKAKDNLLAVKEALERQRREIMRGREGSDLQGLAASGGVKGHIDRIRESMRDGLRRAEEQKEKCQRTARRYLNDRRQLMAEQARQAQEQNSERENFCGNYNSLAAFPGCENEDNFASIAEAAQRARATGSREAELVNAYRRICRRYQSTDEQGSNSSSSRPSVTSARSRCDEQQSPSGRCAELYTIDACKRVAGYNIPATTSTTSTATVGSPTATTTTSTTSTTTTTTATERISRSEYNALYASLNISSGSHGCLPPSESGPRNIRITHACINHLRSQIRDNTDDQLASCRETDADDRNDQIREDQERLAGLIIRSRSTASNPEEEEREWRTLVSQLGENRPSACSSQDNSGNAIVDGFNQGLQAGSGAPAGVTSGP